MTAAVSVPATDVIGHRYATRTKGGENVGHLLTRTWVEEPSRRGRPALCGVRAQRWRAVHLFTEPESFVDCPACSVAAGLAKPPQATVPIAPPAPARRFVDIYSITPAPPSLTAAERLARRIAFRDALPMAPEARSYVPAGLDRRPSRWRPRGHPDTQQPQ